MIQHAPSTAAGDPSRSASAVNGSGTLLASVARFFSMENRYLAPIFITVILLVGQISYGVLESFSRTLLAIGTAIAFELVHAYEEIQRGKKDGGAKTTAHVKKGGTSP